MKYLNNLIEKEIRKQLKEIDFQKLIIEVFEELLNENDIVADLFPYSVGHLDNSLRNLIIKVTDTMMDRKLDELMSERVDVINSEEFLDKIIDRIKGKQLNAN